MATIVDIRRDTIVDIRLDRLAVQRAGFGQGASAVRRQPHEVSHGILKIRQKIFEENE